MLIANKEEDPMQQLHIVRQGDVLIRQVTSIPTSAKKLTGRKELAYGEVTGHSHSIADLDAAYLLEHGDELFMVVTADGGVEIRHEEHAPHQIPPGNYQIVQQEETTFWGRQRVID
jgi:hypothetical protein